MNPKKWVSIFTTACFMLSSVFQAGLQAATDTRVGAPISVVESPIIPPENGSITGISLFPSKQTVINIQDLHCNAEVQRNIAGIIKSLDTAYGIKNIYVEGGYGAIDTSWLCETKDKDAKQEILDSLIDQGRLTGSEYYSVVSNRPHLLKGLENEDIHKANIVRLGKILNRKAYFEQAAARMDRDLQLLKNRYLSSKNARFSQLVLDHKSGSLATEKYYARLKQYVKTIQASPEKFNAVITMDMDTYPNIEAYLDLAQSAKKLNYKRISRQLRQFMTVMKAAVPYSEYNDLVERTDNFSKTGELYGRLSSFADRPEIKSQCRLSCQDLYQFLAYTQRSRDLNALALIDEERRLVEEIRVALSKDVSELEISFLDDFSGYFKDYLFSTLSADDYQYFQQKFGKFQAVWNKYAAGRGLGELSGDFVLLNAYYESNCSRNECFFKNIKAVQGTEWGKQAAGCSAGGAGGTQNGMDDTLKNSELVVVVTGGFHTEGLQKLLRDEKISCLTMTPNVSMDTHAAGAVYAELAKEQAKLFGTQALALALGSMGGKILDIGDEKIIVEMNGERIEIDRHTGDVLGSFEKHQAGLGKDMIALIRVETNRIVDEFTALGNPLATSDLVFELIKAFAVFGAQKDIFINSGMVYKIAADVHVQDAIAAYEHVSPLELGAMPEIFQQIIADKAVVKEKLSAMATTSLLAAIVEAVASSNVSLTLAYVLKPQSSSTVLKNDLAQGLEQVLATYAVPGSERDIQDIVHMIVDDNNVQKVIREHGFTISQDMNDLRELISKLQLILYKGAELDQELVNIAKKPLASAILEVVGNSEKGGRQFVRLLRPLHGTDEEAVDGVLFGMDQEMRGYGKDKLAKALASIRNGDALESTFTVNYAPKAYPGVYYENEITLSYRMPFLHIRAYCKTHHDQTHIADEHMKIMFFTDELREAKLWGLIKNIKNGNMPARGDVAHSNAVVELNKLGTLQQAGSKAGSALLFDMVGLDYPRGVAILPASVKAIAQGDNSLLNTVVNDIMNLFPDYGVAHNAGVSSIGEESYVKGLLSVRSSPVYSMPGILNTVLNLGSNLDWDEYGFPATEPVLRVKIRGMVDYISNVWHIEGISFDAAFNAIMRSIPKVNAGDVSVRRAFYGYFNAVLRKYGKTISEDPKEQLRDAIKAVALSWESGKAQAFRKANGISDDAGLGIIVQEMVFGNKNSNSASGVVFTRDPNTGADKLTGSFLINAQGAELVSGEKAGMSIDEMKAKFSDAYRILQQKLPKLEEAARYPQEVEFTIQDGKIYFLQTRKIRFAPSAETQYMKESLENGNKSAFDYIASMEALQQRTAQRKLYTLKPGVESALVGSGIAATPGVMAGELVDTIEAAKALNAEGKAAILLLTNNNTDAITRIFDLPKVGIITTYGDISSHESVLTRLAGIPSVINVNADVQRELKIGDTIIVDGNANRVLRAKSVDVLAEDTSVMDASFGIDIGDYEQKLRAGLAQLPLEEIRKKNAEAMDEYMQIAEKGHGKDVFVANLKKHVVHKLMVEKEHAAGHSQSQVVQPASVLPLQPVSDVGDSGHEDRIRGEIFSAMRGYLEKSFYKDDEIMALVNDIVRRLVKGDDFVALKILGHSTDGGRDMVVVSPKVEGSSLFIQMHKSFWHSMGIIEDDLSVRLPLNGIERSAKQEDAQLQPPVPDEHVSGREAGVSNDIYKQMMGFLGRDFFKEDSVMHAAEDIANRLVNGENFETIILQGFRGDGRDSAIVMPNVHNGALFIEVHYEFVHPGGTFIESNFMIRVFLNEKEQLLYKDSDVDYEARRDVRKLFDEIAVELKKLTITLDAITEKEVREFLNKGEVVLSGFDMWIESRFIEIKIIDNRVVYKFEDARDWSSGIALPETLKKKMSVAGIAVSAAVAIGLGIFGAYGLSFLQQLNAWWFAVPAGFSVFFGVPYLFSLIGSVVALSIDPAGRADNAQLKRIVRDFAAMNGSVNVVYADAGVASIEMRNGRAILTVNKRWIADSPWGLVNWLRGAALPVILAHEKRHILGQGEIRAYGAMPFAFIRSLFSSSDNTIRDTFPMTQLTEKDEKKMQAELDEIGSITPGTEGTAIIEPLKEMKEKGTTAYEHTLQVVDAFNKIFKQDSAGYQAGRVDSVGEAEKASIVQLDLQGKPALAAIAARINARLKKDPELEKVFYLLPYLHDIGKAVKKEAHPEIGAVYLVGPILKQLGVKNEKTIKMAQLIIGKHVDIATIITTERAPKYLMQGLDSFSKADKRLLLDILTILSIADRSYGERAPKMHKEFDDYLAWGSLGYDELLAKGQGWHAGRIAKFCRVKNDAEAETLLAAHLTEDEAGYIRKYFGDYLQVMDYAQQNFDNFYKIGVERSKNDEGGQVAFLRLAAVLSKLASIQSVMRLNLYNGGETAKDGRKIGLEKTERLFEVIKQIDISLSPGLIMKQLQEQQVTVAFDPHVPFLNIDVNLEGESKPAGTPIPALGGKEAAEVSPAIANSFVSRLMSRVFTVGRAWKNKGDVSLNWHIVDAASLENAFAEFGASYIDEQGQPQANIYLLNSMPQGIAGGALKNIGLNIDGKPIWTGMVGRALVLYAETKDADQVMRSINGALMDKGGMAGSGRLADTFRGLLRSSGVRMRITGFTPGIVVDHARAGSRISYNTDGYMVVSKDVFGTDIPSERPIPVIMRDLSAIKRAESLAMLQNICINFDGLSSIKEFMANLEAFNKVGNAQMIVDPAVFNGLSEKQVQQVLALARESGVKIYIDLSSDNVQKGYYKDAGFSGYVQTENRMMRVYDFLSDQAGIKAEVISGYADADQLRTRLMNSRESMKVLNLSELKGLLKGKDRDILDRVALLELLKGAIVSLYNANTLSTEFVKTVAYGWDRSQLPSLPADMQNVLSAVDKGNSEEILTALGIKGTSSAVNIYVAKLANEVDGPGQKERLSGLQREFLVSIIERMLAKDKLVRMGKTSGLADQGLETLLGQKLLQQKREGTEGKGGEIAAAVFIKENKKQDAAAFFKALDMNIRALAAKPHDPKAINALVDLIPLAEQRVVMPQGRKEVKLNAIRVKAILSAA